jgi:hypothetical protein
VDNWKKVTNSRNRVRKKSFGGTFCISNASYHKQWYNLREKIYIHKYSRQKARRIQCSYYRADHKVVALGANKKLF